MPPKTAWCCPLCSTPTPNNLCLTCSNCTQWACLACYGIEKKFHKMSSDAYISEQINVVCSACFKHTSKGQPIKELGPVLDKLSELNDKIDHVQQTCMAQFKGVSNNLKTVAAAVPSISSSPTDMKISLRSWADVAKMSRDECEQAVSGSFNTATLVVKEAKTRKDKQLSVACFGLPLPHHDHSMGDLLDFTKAHLTSFANGRDDEEFVLRTVNDLRYIHTFADEKKDGVPRHKLEFASRPAKEFFIRHFKQYCGYVSTAAGVPTSNKAFCRDDLTNAQLKQQWHANEVLDEYRSFLASDEERRSFVLRFNAERSIFSIVQVQRDPNGRVSNTRIIINNTDLVLSTLKQTTTSKK